MRELKVSPEELKNIIDNGKMIGKGFFGTVFTYQDKLIKLDKSLYNLLEVNDKSLAKEVIENHYKFPDQREDFNSRDQIEYLANQQKHIKLTRLPEGIVTLKDVNSKINGISPGIIIPYHMNHQKLERLSKKDYLKVLIILKNLLLAVKELADNRISQEDLIEANSQNKHKYNVMYKDTTPQIIDLSGEFIVEGDYFINAREMYRGLGNIIFDFINDENFPREELTSYEENKELLDDYERSIKK